MKNMKILMVCGFMLGSVIAACDRPNLHQGWLVKYTPVDFAFPLDHDEPGILYPENKLIPSKVGFYNGDINEYNQKLEEAYPLGSCVLECTSGGTWWDDVNSEKKVEIRDDSGRQFFEHVIQDAVMQQIISNKLGTTKSLKSKKEQAVKSKDFYQTLICCGLNCLGKKAELPTLSPALLRNKVYDARAREYVKYKNEVPKSLFTQARDTLVIDMSSKNLGDYGFNFTQQQLKNAYAEMSEKVLLDHQIQALNKEKYGYQRAIIGYTSQFLIVATALSIGRYVWTTKK